MPKTSAGILLFRRSNNRLEFLLVHPGGPFFKNKDAGAWTIPKGEVKPEEDLLSAAIREFEEELGQTPPGPFTPLGSIKQKAGKTVHAWTCESDLDPATIKSNTVIIEWPPRSGKQHEFAEIDRAQWFDLESAREKINPAQIPLLDQLAGTT